MASNGKQRKVMAAYRRVYGFGHLQADCSRPGSISDPYAHTEYRYKYLLMIINNNNNKTDFYSAVVSQDTEALIVRYAKTKSAGEQQRLQNYVS